MKRLFLFVALALVLCAGSASAQTRFLEFDLDGVSVAAANGFTYTVTNNGQAVTAATVTCTAKAAPAGATCRRSITLAPGRYNLVVTVSGNGLTIASDPLVQPEDPVKPTNLRLTMSVVVHPDGTAEMLAFNVENLGKTP